MRSDSSAPSSTDTGAEPLPLSARLAVGLQREVSRLLSPLWVPGVIGVLRFGFGYQIEDVEPLRRQYQRIHRGSPGPLLICANHLTIDRKSTRLNSSHSQISYAVFCLK